MRFKRFAAILLSCLLLAAFCVGCSTQSSSHGTDPTAIMVWHYYNGDQQKIFDELVQEFNETVGAEKSILVESHSYGGVNELNEKVLDAIYERIGSADVPDIFASYADTAYEVNALGKAADLSAYLTAEEEAQYIPSYLDEGRFTEGGNFRIFPVAKSTELLLLNKTEWDAFSAATGATDAGLVTWEGLVSLAGQYYDWTDSLTPDVPDDGRPFFGRDAFANYIIIGSYQLGVELFQVYDGQVTVNIDRDVMRRLWDCYYVPYVSGWFGAFGKFRTDDVRTGDLAACVCSTSGAAFFPGSVTTNDGASHDIVGAAYPLPNFAGTEAAAVQQGAGMVVSKTSEARERAAVEFLKWFTAPEQNVRFAAASGYLPVTYAANDTAFIDQVAEGRAEPMPAILKDSLSVGMEMTQSYRLYTSKAFEGGSTARVVCESSMREKARADHAEVVALIAGGASREDALSAYLTDANFERWLESFRSDMDAAVGQ